MAASRIVAVLVAVGVPAAAITTLYRAELEASGSRASLAALAEMRAAATAAADLRAESSMDLLFYSNGHVDNNVDNGGATDNTADSGGGADNTVDNGGATENTDSFTYSPEERAAMHASKFEKEFTIELNMTRAHDEGMQVGVALDMDTDFNPVSVLTIKKTGLLEAWNKENPDRAVLVGDEIIKVNDILWHHNSQTFAQRIKGQFDASKKKVAGAKDVMIWGIQRPRKERDVRYKSQREDLHKQLYSKEFVAEIPMKGVKQSDTVQQAMGWTLNTTVDWMPVSIEKLRNKGMIVDYNKEHPDTKIFSGDEILQVNQVQWHHSAKTFEERIKAQFVAGQRAVFLSKGVPTTSFVLHIRRPRSVKDAPDDAIYTRQFLVELPLKDAHPIGWRLNSSIDADPLVVEKVKWESPLGEFNKAFPTKSVQPGDSVVRVNNFLWHGNSKKFADRIGKEFERLRPRKGQLSPNATLKLLMQRRLVQPIVKEWTAVVKSEEGMPLGWQLNVTDDAFPVAVSKIRNNGMVFEFNQAHPEARIQSGDIIVKVNDELWRQNSETFEKRLNQLYSKSMKNGSISFFLRRPAVVSQEEEGPNSRPFFKEFIVKLPITADATFGWQLNSDNQTAPVSVAKVRGVGLVHEWNEANPLNDVQVGDQISRVNTVLFHGNAKQFLERMNLQIDAAKRGHSKPMITLLLQRPWRTNTAFQEEDQGNSDGGDDGVVGGGEDDVMGAQE